MEKDLSPAEARRLRERNDWTLQYLANKSGINKAYLSEFENGLRVLADDLLVKLKQALTQEAAGKATPSLVSEGGHSRLVFINPETKEVYRPRVAHLKWTEDDGTTYTMYLGET